MNTSRDQALDLSRRERQIMDLLYEYSEQSARDIERNLPDAPSYSAVRALIARLLEKGHVQARRSGTKYIYAPVQAAKKVQGKALHRLIKTFFQGSRFGAVNALLDYEGESLSDSEVKEIERKLERLKYAKKLKEQ